MLMPDQPEHRSWSWQLPDDRRAPARANQDDPVDEEPSFRRAVVYTIAGTAIPGLRTYRRRRRIIGSIILGLFAASVWPSASTALLIARAFSDTPWTPRRCAGQPSLW
jgi:hypothetical protein